MIKCRLDCSTVRRLAVARGPLIALLALSGCAAVPVSCLAASAPPSLSDPTLTSNTSVLTADQVIKILDETVDWYRTLGTQQQTATQPSDVLIVYANRQTADQVVSLAFEIARANAELLSSEAGTGSASSAASAGPGLNALQTRLTVQRQATQTEIAENRRLLATTHAGAKTELEARLSELQGEIDMINARKNLLDTMSQFVSETNAKTASADALKQHIDAIAMSVPSVNLGGTGTPANPAAATAAVAAGNGTGAGHPGIWQMISNVLRLSDKLSTINAIDQRTAELDKTFVDIRTPPLKRLKALSARSDVLAVQADNATGAALKTVRGPLDTLAWLFKQTSAILIPLSKEGVLLQQYRHNLSSWRDATKRQYRAAMEVLAARVGVLVLLLAIVFAGGELWRRAVLHYAREPRRRSQLMLVRKIVLWIAVVAIVGLTFITELSSFATFAGLITAGVAVAMQSVLVSIVGYFFLIGKYGIRVGDRIQIGTVVGDVIDIGLVRMHLLELNQNGPLGPTGRVVAFANLIVFQASGGLFKQIPGVNLSWHETILALPLVSDYAVLKKKLLAAVNDVVAEYHEELVRQTKEIERTTESSSIDDSEPQVQMHLSEGHMQALIRYPVHLKHEAEIDERVSEAILKVISESTEGKTGTP